MLNLIDIKAVCRKLGGVDSPVHAATVYRAINAGKLPKPVKIAGGNASRWLEGEIDAAIEARIAERDGAEAA